MSLQLPVPGGLPIPPFRGGPWRTEPSGMGMLVVGPSGSGKGQCILIPTLLGFWRGSVVAADPKGELLAHCGKFMRQFAHVLPFAPKRDLDQTVCFNPLFEVRPGRDPRRLAGMPLDKMSALDATVGDAMKVIDGVTGFNLDRDGGNDFKQQARNLHIAFALHVLHARPDHQKHLGTVLDMLSRGDEAVAEVLAVAAHPFPVQVCRTLMESGGAKGDGGKESKSRYRGSVYGVAQTSMQLWADPMLAAATSRSDFRISDLMCAMNPVALFLVVPPAYRTQLMPLVRLMFEMVDGAFMVNEATDREGREKRHRLLMQIDEAADFTYAGAPATGRQMRSFGMTPLFATAEMEPLEKRFGDSINALCQTKVLFRPESDRERERMARMLGEVEVEETSESRSYDRRIGGGFKSRNVSSHKRRVPLLSPTDLARWPRQRWIAVEGQSEPGEGPMLCDWRPAYKDPLLRTRLGVPTGLSRLWRREEPLELRRYDGQLIDPPYAPPSPETLNPWAGRRVFAPVVRPAKAEPPPSPPVSAPAKKPAPAKPPAAAEPKEPEKRKKRRVLA